MAITYDRNGLKKMEKWIEMGSNKYALRTSMFMSLFNAIFITLFFILFDYNDKIKVDWYYTFFKFFILFFFLFITNYFIQKRQWRGIKKTYEESIEYWEKTDSEFLK